MFKKHFRIAASVWVVVIIAVLTFPGLKALFDQSATGQEADTQSGRERSQKTQTQLVTKSLDVIDISSLPEEELSEDVINGVDPGPDPKKYWERELRPFDVVKKTLNYEWTNEDGRDPAIMQQLANNPIMLEAP